MNAEKYTQKSLEAVKAAQELTIQNQNQQIEQAHLLAALLRQDGGLVPQLLKKNGRYGRKSGRCRRQRAGEASARDRFGPRGR